MIVQWIIIVSFWLSYLAISFAAVITIADFVQRIVQKRRLMKPVPADMQHEQPVKLHISEGLIQVDRLADDQPEEA